MKFAVLIKFALFCSFTTDAYPANESGILRKNFELKIRCTAIENQEGLCVNLDNCVPLLELLEQIKHEGETNTRALRILQRSTWSCSPNGVSSRSTAADLKVCCPIKFLPIELREPIQKPLFERIKKDDSRQSTNVHPNFYLLPDIGNCGIVSISDRVVGGTSVNPGAYPFIVRIGYKVLKSGTILHGCGGSLINDNYVITAAHCVSGIGSSAIPDEVRLGEYNIDTNPDCSKELGCVSVLDVKIEKIIVHPSYSALHKWNDIALVRLKKSINFTNQIQPICLPFLEEYGMLGLELYYDNFPAIVAGFGKTRWNKAIGSPILQHTEIPIQSHSKCAKLYLELNYLNVTSKQICAGGVTGGDSCDGDSGGPLIVNKFYQKLETNKLFQIGIVSYGSKRCGLGDLPGVYTRISEYKNFVLDSIQP